MAEDGRETLDLAPMLDATCVVALGPIEPGRAVGVVDV